MKLNELLQTNAGYKVGANILFLVCASFLNIAVLIEIPNNAAGKAVFVALGIGLEIIAAYTLALAASRKDWRLYSAYALQVAFALVLHMLYGLSSINISEGQNNAVLVNVERSIDTIRQNDRMIANLIAVIDAEKTNGIGPRYQQAFARIEDLKAENSRLTVTATETNAIKKTGVFHRYGAFGETLKFAIFILLSLLSQWALYITKWTIPDAVSAPMHEAPQPDGLRAYIIANRTNLLRYIDALCREGSEALNGDRKISERLEVSAETAAQFRRTLASVKYSGKPLIETTQGGSRRNFTADEMKQIIVKI